MRHDVYVSAVIPQPIEKVWRIARDFNGHAEWHPIIAESRIEGGGPSDAVGCVRNFTLKDGLHLRETLLTLSDLDHSFTYDITEVSGLPLTQYHATFRLRPITATGETFAEWYADFRIADSHRADFTAKVRDDTFAAGLAALAKAAA